MRLLTTLRLAAKSLADLLTKLLRVAGRRHLSNELELGDLIVYRYNFVGRGNTDIRVKTILSSVKSSLLINLATGLRRLIGSGGFEIQHLGWTCRVGATPNSIGKRSRNLIFDIVGLI